MTNPEKVQDIYRAFGRGDVPKILSYLSPAVEWEYGPNSTDVPWLQPRRGPAGAATFFESLGALEIHAFVPKHFLGSGEIIVVLCDIDATVKATGRRFVEEDETHIWHFDAYGLVARFRHRVDTHQHQLAYQPV